MKRTRRLSPAGLEIKMAMYQQNMTVKELANKIQKSEATVCEVMSGKNRSEKTRALILKELNFSTNASWESE